MSDRKNDFALMQTDRGICERALQEAWERDHEDERAMIQRYDDDHLPHPDGCWVMHKDIPDLAQMQRRVELLEAFVAPAKVLVDILPNTCKCEQCAAVEALEKAIAALEGKS